MAETKRPAMRFPAQVERAEIIARTTGRVVDESQSGIAIAVIGPLALTIGQVVEIDYDGAAMKAIVRRTEQHADGSWVVGFQWQ